MEKKLKVHGKSIAEYKKEHIYMYLYCATLLTYILQ